MTRLLRKLAWFAIFMLLAGPTLATAHAQETTTSGIPGFGPIGPGATLSYLISGELAEDVAPGSHLIVERIALDAGDVIPTLDPGQILVNESGELSLTDDLGLEATLEPGTPIFIASEGYRDLTAEVDSRVLRAYVASPVTANTITIAEAGCDPAKLTLLQGTPLVVENATDRSQTFAIPLLALNQTIAPSASVEIPTDAFGYGTWRAACGETAAETTYVAITISSLAQPATPVTDTLPNATTIFDQELDAIEPGATLFVAEVELAGSGGSLGEQTYNGMTGIMAAGAPLMVERPDHLPAKLPEQQALFFPAETVATVTNEATPTATLLIAGIVEPTTPEEEPPVATPDDGPDGPDAPSEQPPRPTTPDDQPETQASLETYLPDDSDAAAAGFVTLTTQPTTGVADSVFNGLENEPNDGGWEAGITCIYLPTGEWTDLTGVLVGVDQFDTVESATLAVNIFALGSAIIGEPFDPPASATADQVIGFTTDAPEQSITVTFIMAQYGNIVVTTATLAPMNEETEPAAIALWEVVDEANS